MPSAIDPAAIPGQDINPEAIAANAATVGTIAGQVQDHGSAVHRKWQAMAGVYTAPESATVLGLMDPVNSSPRSALSISLAILPRTLVP